MHICAWYYMIVFRIAVAALGFVRTRHRAISISVLIAADTIISGRPVLNDDLTLIWLVLAAEPAYAYVCITENKWMLDEIGGHHPCREVWDSNRMSVDR